MAIFVDESTRLVVQGLTGSEGRFHGLRNRAYGTKVVAGVTPGKGGQDVEGVPVYRFEWGAGDTRILRLLGELGRPTDRMRLASGELLATAEGEPVRLEVRLVGNDGSDRTVTLRVDYSEIGSEIEVRSPRVGRPLVVRSS